MYHDKGHHAAWLACKNAKEKTAGSTNGTTDNSTEASTDGNNSHTLVAIGNKIDQNLLFGRKTIHEDASDVLARCFNGCSRHCGYH